MVHESSSYDDAAAALRSGKVVALPTDTVYGLAALATSPEGLDRIFDLKGRAREMDLAVLVASDSQALGLVSRWPAGARRLAAEFWPGGLTMVLRRAGGLDWDLGASRSTIGIRCPQFALVQQLCEDLGPLAVTSANRHGHSTPIDAAGVSAVFGSGLAVVVDGGECGGIASTVVDCTGETPVCLRQGALDWDLVLRAWFGPEPGPDEP